MAHPASPADARTREGVTALDERMRDGVAEIGGADLLVGIPSYNNASTVEHVARCAARGLRENFPDARGVIVNADGGSSDGTSERVRAGSDGVPVVSGPYRGIPGKGSAFRAIFEAAGRLGVRACAVVDSDLRSISPEWIARLIGPIVEGRATYVAPLYARHKHDGTITNSIAYPLTRALYGLRVRQPIGGDFGFSGELARAFLEGGAGGSAPGSDGAAAVWESDVAKFGIDVYMTTTALVRHERVAQAFLGAKIHDPKDPGADLAPMFAQVVGTAFRLAIGNAGAWEEVEGSRPAEVLGESAPVEPEAVNASAEILRQNFLAGAARQHQVWEEMLGADQLALVDDAAADRVPAERWRAGWARIVYDTLLACHASPERIGAFVASLVPLYFARVEAFIAEVAGVDTAGAERAVEGQARAFEEEKPYLRAGWDR